MDNETHMIKVGGTAHGQFETGVNIERAGWEWSSIRMLVLPAGGSETVASGVPGLLVLPLSGGCTAEVNGKIHVLNGCKEVWSAITGYLYIPRGATLTVRNEPGGQFALSTAKATRNLSVRYCPVAEVVTALRGVGPCSRQVSNYALGNDLETSHLLTCEVLTPGGNRSSYPPHKHNEHNEVERILKEIYYYKVRPGLNGSPGTALQRIYPSDHDIDVCAEVHSRGVVTMPHGCHDSSTAVPGYDLYYLNVMAGPAEDSAWLMTDDPAYTRIRDAQASQDVDPRFPTTPLG